MFVLTRKQREAVHTLWVRQEQGSFHQGETYKEFRKNKVRPMLFSGGAVEVYPWHNTYVGVETDGYTHT